MPWTERPQVAALRRRNRFVDVVVETLDGFRYHLTGRNSAVLTYYGFLTLFPLFLAASTVLGFVLEGDAELRRDLVDSAISQVPFIGDQIASDQIGGSWLALIIGLTAAVWGSLKAFIGLQRAYDDTWEVPLDARSSFVTQRVRALVGLAVIGGAQIGTVVLAAVVDQVSLPRISQVMIVLGGLAINVSVSATMYRFLTSAATTWHMVWPGAIFAGMLYTAVQFAGTALTRRMLQSADTYGDFAGVLALLSWLSLHATINLFGAEINGALHRLGDVARPTAPSPIDQAGDQRAAGA